MFGSAICHKCDKKIDHRKRYSLKIHNNADLTTFEIYFCKTCFLKTAGKEWVNKLNVGYTKAILKNTTDTNIPNIQGPAHSFKSNKSDVTIDVFRWSLDGKTWEEGHKK